MNIKKEPPVPVILIEKNSSVKYQAAVVKYLKAQSSGLIATLVDFSFTILLKEIFGFWYMIAVGIGALAGAVTAYLLNRYWVFRSWHSPHHVQAFRYLLVVIGSIILNTTLVYALTEITGISYLVSKTVVAVLIGLTYNYYMAKRFVFV